MTAVLQAHNNLPKTSRMALPQANSMKTIQYESGVGVIAWNLDETQWSQLI